MGSGRSLTALIHSLRRINIEHVQDDIRLGSESATAGGSFEAALAERVQQLQLQGGGGSAHLNWLLDACACTLSTHSSLASLLTHKLLRPASHRADEVLSLLDVCTSLKQVVSDVDRQLGLLQRALQIVEQAMRAPQISSANIRAAAHRLRACLQGLQVLASKQYRPAEDALVASLLGAKRFQLPPITSSDPLNHALDGTLLLSLLVLTSALSSLERPTRCGATRSACKLIARYASSTCSKSTSTAAVWVAPLRQLQRDLKQEEMGAVFLELEGLHASASSLLAAMTADHMNIVNIARQSIDSLRKRSQEAQACILTLRSHLASLFQALLALRLAFLH